MNSRPDYPGRERDFESRANLLAQKINSLSFTRLGLFIGLAGLFISYFSLSQSVFLWISLPVAFIFYRAVTQSNKLKESKLILDALAKINREEIERSKINIKSFDGGERFMEKDHPYQGDLDILGRHSLFQLINRCENEDAKKALASRLSTHASRSEILGRQEAIRELSEKIDWMQHFNAVSRVSLSKKKKNDPEVSSNDIVSWLISNSNTTLAPVWKVIVTLLALSFISTILLVSLEMISHTWIYPLAIINTIILPMHVRKLNQLMIGIDKAHTIVNTYLQMIRCIEQESFSSPLLKELHQNLSQGKACVSKRIESFGKLLHRISGRANMLYAILDLPFLLDTHLLLDLIKWKNQNFDDAKTWFDTVDEFAVLISMASFSANNPHYTFPEIVDHSFHFSALQIGHPLISGEEKVRNDYEISGQGHIDIITGSNMSGKSTFQRTVGLNMVLAQCGCPVDAKNLVMGITSVFTGMRTSDDLENHTSSFYAELKRIEQLLHAIQNQPSTFFILDEILKGTNSKDRHEGAKALTLKMMEKNVFGLISTHDLELGEIAKSTDRVRNYSFNSKIEGEKILFNYQLTDGICNSFNASKLMKNVGIL